MSFYEEIADFYDLIFPLNRAQIGFVKASVEPPYNEKRILDIGCGTGDLALALAEEGFMIEGIDSDAEMLRRARSKIRQGSLVAFAHKDMREVSSLSCPATFDAVLCFGNTLVHLDSSRDIEDFFGQTKTVLKENAPFLFQILNYDHILDHDIRELPLIEDEEIKFERRYEFKGSENRIAFRTLLTVKKRGKKIANEILLYPIRRQELEEGLRKQGFTDIVFYGDFEKGELKTQSLPLVGEAR
jgi:cyclopropane fatty-acyl-phospholipid synthase-like methyltransferase